MKYTREQLAAWMQGAGFSRKEKQDYLDNNLFRHFAQWLMLSPHLRVRLAFDRSELFEPTRQSFFRRTILGDACNARSGSASCNGIVCFHPH